MQNLDLQKCHLEGLARTTASPRGLDAKTSTLESPADNRLRPVVFQAGLKAGFCPALASAGPVCPGIALLLAHCLAARPLPPAYGLGDGAKPPENRQSLPVDVLHQLWQDGAGMNENEKHFSLTRVALSTCGRAKSKFQSVGLDLSTMGLVILVWPLLTAGCGKGSGLEGKVTDRDGKPIAGLKIIAKQVEPIKGYELFAVETRADGAFRFKGLYPEARYTLVPEAKTWTTDSTEDVAATADGQTRLLRQPFVIRRALSRDRGIEVRPTTGEPLSSSLESKVVDALGSGLANVTVVATSKDAKKGYEEVRAVNGPDGTFQLSGLYPEQAYTLVPSAGTWITKESSEVTAGKDGETRRLFGPFAIKMAVTRDGGSLLLDITKGKTRYSVSTEGAITDTISGLEWVVLSTNDISSYQAVAAAVACKIGGGGWRMPTLEELGSLCIKGLGECNIDPVFKMTGEPRVWSDRTFNFGDTQYAKDYQYSAGGSGQNYRNMSQGMRAFAVRSARK